jgi:hypothetical protein
MVETPQIWLAIKRIAALLAAKSGNRACKNRSKALFKHHPQNILPLSSHGHSDSNLVGLQ